MFFLEHKVPYAMPNVLGNHSFPVHTYKWQQIAACEEKYPLENLIPPRSRNDYRIISNEPNKGV